MTKLKKIKEAYGPYWEELKNLVDENGWISIYVINDQIEKIYDVLDVELKEPYREDWRIKTLENLEDNNGWIKIESENDLPSLREDVDINFAPDVFIGCHLKDNNNTKPKTQMGNWIWRDRLCSGKNIYDMWKLNLITHYKMIDIELPLY